MPSIAKHDHELRVRDERATSRIVYRIDSNAVVIPDGFATKTQATPHSVIDTCQRRLAAYDALS